MAISKELNQAISDTYQNQSIGQELVGAINASSNMVQAPRVATISTSLSPQSDYRVLLNSTSGSPVVTLPAGVNGQTFAIAYHPSNSQTWTMTPNGSDTLSSAVTSAMSGKTNVNIQHLNGVWYAV